MLNMLAILIRIQDFLCLRSTRRYLLLEDAKPHALSRLAESLIEDCTLRDSKLRLRVEDYSTERMLRVAGSLSRIYINCYQAHLPLFVWLLTYK